MRKTWGQTIHITDTMAHNPMVLKGFVSFYNALDQGGLSAEDREVICMDMAVRNGCHYCVPAHLTEAKARGVDMELITQIARGALLTGDSRAALLQRLTRRLMETGGKLSDAELSQARANGFDNAQLIAILAEIAHCHFTNSFNRLANTEPDAHYPEAPNLTDGV
ncbi:MAG: carboxymuconolactone decarboxylase family protein [Pseudomonadota bacterium]